MVKPPAVGAIKCLAWWVKPGRTMLAKLFLGFACWAFPWLCCRVWGIRFCLLILEVLDLLVAPFLSSVSQK